MTAQDLSTAYSEIQAEATLLAGDLLDIPRRAAVLHEIFLDSGRNHTFPQMAVHGALWAFSFFEVGGRLGRLIGKRYFYNSRERAFRLGLLQSFAEDFRRINRSVCIDTYTNYHFSKRRGREPGADQFVHPDLLAELNQVHECREAGHSMTPDEQRNVFQQSFLWEQELTVAPGVKDAIESFDCRFMRALCMRPVVRFSFFPWCRFLWFRNFYDTDERIRKGLQAYDFAQAAGWDQVVDSTRSYGLLSETALANPQEHYRSLTRDLLPDERLEKPGGDNR